MAWCFQVPFCCLLLTGFPFIALIWPLCYFILSHHFVFSLKTGALLPHSDWGGKEGASHVQCPEEEGGAGERNTQNPAPGSATHPLWKCRCHTWTHTHKLVGNQLGCLKLYISQAANSHCPISGYGTPRPQSWLANAMVLITDINVLIKGREEAGKLGGSCSSRAEKPVPHEESGQFPANDL